MLGLLFKLFGVIWDNGNRYITCRDLATLIQMIGRLSFYFTDDFTARYDMLTDLLKRIVGVLQYSAQNNLYLIDKLFADVHAEGLATFQAFSFWMVEFGNVVQTLSPLMFRRLNPHFLLDGIVLVSKCVLPYNFVKCWKLCSN